MADRLQRVALPSVPATAATSAGIAAKLVLHDTAAAWAIASLAGLLTLIAIFAASSECQKTLRVWIRHRAEHRIAGAKSFEIRRRARVATSGPRWSKAGAREVRQAAASFRGSAVDLSDVMLITRIDRLGAPRQRLQDGYSRPHPGEDNGIRVPLEVVQERTQPLA
jgi:hypothetical protein